MKRKTGLPLLLFIPVIIFFSFIGDKDDPRSKYAETISSADLKKHLSILASDEYQGRETTKRGQKKAAEYIAKQFFSMGIMPIRTHDTHYPQGTTRELDLKEYYQDVPLEFLFPGEATVSFYESQFSFGEDFYYLPGGDNQKLNTTEAVFAGYGIQDSLYRDYDGVNVKDKTVIVLNGEPKNKKGKYLISGNKDISSWTEQRRRKANEAKKLGAAALLIVVDDYKKTFEEYKDYISSPTLRIRKSIDPIYSEWEKPEMPVLYISREMADAILQNGKQKQNIKKAISTITKKQKPLHVSFALPINISIQRKSEKTQSENVLGYIEGTDLKEELLVITAHYDHLGVDKKDSTIVFNGADDDGSGTVAVLEIAEAFAKAKKDGRGPRRSILFMCVTGEEKGLLGSKWYTDHPVFPLKNTVCNLNIDMIGRIDPAHKNDTNYIYVIGSDRLSTELKQINESNNAKYTGMLLDYKYDAPDEPNNFYGRSDHYNFAKHNIPIAFFFNGTHADYHKESDEVSKINFSLMERRAHLVFYDAWEIANRDKRLIVDGKTTK